MNALSLVFTIKIFATISCWCAPLILFPAPLLERLGFPPQQTYMFPRMLGWAYLALCVGYAFGLRESLHGRRALGPVWVGIVSNGGACAYLVYYGLSGTWVEFSPLMRVLLWGSAAATLAITAGLVAFGLLGRDPASAAT